MKRNLYPKLALLGIRKNRKTYGPYILTCIGMVMMFYIISFLSTNPAVSEMRGGDMLQSMLGLGCGVIGVFSLVLLFYTNSFLIRRRKREFGLYNILGMGKRNISRILIWETLFIAIGSIVFGLFCGILFSKVAELCIAWFLDTNVSFGFTISGNAVSTTLWLFLIIFLFILFHSLHQVHVSNPVELLRSEAVGEKPPKANWFLAAVGIVLLGGAYYLAVSIEDPVSAIIWFFVAVLMVIGATYLLFIAGSVTFCRLLQKKKKYYYKTNHFISISSMLYRMKRNGAGLASICILSTMVLVMISSTACLYIGSEDSLRSRYPRNIVVDTYSVDPVYTEPIQQAVLSCCRKKEKHRKISSIIAIWMWEVIWMETRCFLTKADFPKHKRGIMGISDSFLLFLWKTIIV